jgi:hypothetical protein
MRRKWGEYRTRTLPIPLGNLQTTITAAVEINYPAPSVLKPEASCTQPQLPYNFRFARRELAAARFFFELTAVRVFRALFIAGRVRFLTAAAARLAARRTPGFASETLSVKAFWTAPALAAIVPSVDPIDSATLVKTVSSLDAL